MRWIFVPVPRAFIEREREHVTSTLFLAISIRAKSSTCFPSTSSLLSELRINTTRQHHLRLSRRLLETAAVQLLSFTRQVRSIRAKRVFAELSTRRYALQLRKARHDV